MKEEIKVVDAQPRWKSKVLWAAILAQIVSILVMVGAIDTGLGETVNNVGAAVLQLLTLFGVVNNPTDKQHM